MDSNITTMPNICKSEDKKLISDIVGLDKSEQLRKNDQKTTSSSSSSKQHRKARLKYVGKNIFAKLMTLLKSPNRKGYVNGYYCSDAISYDADGNKKVHYCGHRFCPTCNSIRTAKLIDKYEETFKKWENPFMVTLTLKSVDSIDLYCRVDYMLRTFSKINDLSRKYDKKLICMRGIEITYNGRTDMYHPHFHILCKSREMADFILAQWLKRHPDTKECSPDAQDIRPAKDVKELFKYVTKLFKKDKNTYRIYNEVVLDNIMSAVYRRRVIQAYGFVAKPEIDEENFDEVENTDERTYKEQVFVFNSEKCDWFCMTTGESYTNFGNSEIPKVVFMNPPPG